MPRARRPQSTVVLFVRHGETPTTGKHLPGRAPGLHLSEHGRDQAKRVAEAIAAPGAVAAIYTSPLERTRQTAQAIADATGLDVHTVPDLVDLDIGDWTGMELKAAAKLPEWRTVQRFPSVFRFPGGESFVDLQGRMLGVVERLVRDHPGETVVAVSHADPIRITVAAALGVPLDLFQRLMVAPCSVSAVAYGQDGAAVLCVNSTADGLPVPRPPAKPKPKSKPVGRRRS
ncbi:MAG: histidine phosphatase family protein [Acidimicrobiales bacterium]